VDETQQIIIDAYDTLPNDVQKFMLSDEFMGKVDDLAKKFNLESNQEIIFENETLIIMLGIDHPKNFIENLRDRLQINAEKAREVAQEVNSQIFRPIRESLKIIHNMEPQSKSIGKPASAPEPQEESVEAASTGMVDDAVTQKPASEIEQKAEEQMFQPLERSLEKMHSITEKDIREDIERAELNSTPPSPPPRQGFADRTKTTEGLSKATAVGSMTKASPRQESASEQTESAGEEEPFHPREATLRDKSGVSTEPGSTEVTTRSDSVPAIRPLRLPTMPEKAPKHELARPTSRSETVGQAPKQELGQAGLPAMPAHEEQAGVAEQKEENNVERKVEPRTELRSPASPSEAGRAGTGDETLSRDKILNEIENPPNYAKITAQPEEDENVSKEKTENLVEEKLKDAFKPPKKSSSAKPQSPSNKFGASKASEHTDIPPQNQSKARYGAKQDEEHHNTHYSSVDPYREQIE